MEQRQESTSFGVALVDEPANGHAVADRASDQASRPSTAGVGVQIGLVVAVVVTGCANNISKQIAAKPLASYTYMLGLATAVAYVPLYGAILLFLVWGGTVPKYQLEFVWRARRSCPYIVYFVVAAAGDTLGDVIGMICTPYVSGPVHSLLSNCTSMFIAVLSMCVLRKRYSLLQCLALLGVLTAVVLGVLPSFLSGASHTANAFFAIVLGASCIFNAISFVVKELLFERYRKWLDDTGHNTGDSGKGLHVFIVNTHAAIFQLPLTLLIVPLNQALGQTHGKSIPTYVREALSCVFSSTSAACGPDSHGAEWASTCVMVYVVFNILWNVSILMAVKKTGALATFVALKLVFPVSTLLFAYVDWPLLGTTSLSLLIWLSLAAMVPSIAFFQWASTQQAKRAAQSPSLATCCWPLGRGARRS